MEVTETSDTTKTRTIKLHGFDIAYLLREQGVIKTLEIVKAITIEIPSGGDYSGMELDIDNDNPIKVTVQA